VIFCNTFGESNDMHAQLQPIEGSPGHQVSAQRILLGQVCSEVHFLPLVSLLDILISGESELSQVPTPDQIDLTSFIIIND
jgi:hypothetical protein